MIESVNLLFKYLQQLSHAQLWFIFAVENLIITVLVITIGEYIRNKNKLISNIASTCKANWRLCLLTNLINTIITYLGFWLYAHGFISIENSLTWQILIDFSILFFLMDFLMYCFHILIHKTFLYKAVHQLHHQSIHPKPIDLFLLHPIETIGFGLLWLSTLLIIDLNIFAIIFYLIINVIFGMIGHLGIEPIPLRLTNKPIVKYLGTSTFHHNHHQHIHYNFGFYTNIWDKLFGTLK